MKMANDPSPDPDEWPPEVVAKVNRDRDARNAVRQQYRQLFADVSAAMFRHDPIGINFDTNADEYDAEAGTVIPRLKDCKCSDDVATVLHEEFCEWFGPETAGPKSLYAELAVEIWNLWTTNEKEGGTPVK